jgi:hypothetical protein
MSDILEDDTLIDVLDEPDSQRLSEADSDCENGSVKKKQKRQNSITAITEADAFSSDWRRQQEYYIKNPPENTVYEEMPAGHPLYKCLMMKQPRTRTQQTAKKLAILTEVLVGFDYQAEF